MPSGSAHELQPLESDTIAAIATPVGRGGIGMVRLSGPEALVLAEQLVTLRNPLQPGRIRYGLLIDEAGKRIDDAITTFYRAPHSYTGEDVVEIATHGSPVVLEWLLSATMRAGARLARPGEFTERAFLRGRLDLTQAEAVRELIDAQTLGQAHLAAEQIGGSLAREVRPIQQQLIQLIATLEAGIDFAEDDLETMPDSALAHAIALMLPPLQTLLHSFTHGRLLREGLRLAIVGKPNTGKSSLFNRLLARERAIVTPVAGTTRDIVSERLVLDGVPIDLLDTAGLRETTDEVERIGVARSQEAIAEADLVLLVIDAQDRTQQDTQEDLASTGLDQMARAVQGRPLLVVVNKIDLVTNHSHREEKAHVRFHNEVRTSAVTGEGIDALRVAILRTALGESVRAPGTAMLTNLRQHDSIAQCLQALATASTACQNRTPHEMLLLDLYSALRALNLLTGETTSDDILNLIFSTFCIGK